MLAYFLSFLFFFYSLQNTLKSIFVSEDSFQMIFETHQAKTG